MQNKKGNKNKMGTRTRWGTRTKWEQKQDGEQEQNRNKNKRDLTLTFHIAIYEHSHFVAAEKVAKDKTFYESYLIFLASFA